MKLLPDENLPKKLKSEFSAHEVFTVFEMGWAGKTNGELLKLMLSENFDVLLTFDKNLQHQQNFQRYSIMVLVFSAASNTFASLQPLCPSVIRILDNGLISGPIVISAVNL